MVGNEPWLTQPIVEKVSATAVIDLGDLKFDSESRLVERLLFGRFATGRSLLF
ncbi:MAG: hypothetical protein ACKOXX_07050 [Actinomycetota bacterium]